MMFYCYIEQFGNRIFHRYFDGDRHHSEIVKEFPIYLYIPNRNGDFKSIMGETLSEVSFDCILDAKEFVDRYKDVEGIEVYGNDDWVQQFIAHRYPDEVNIDLSKMKVLSFDLEVEHGGQTIYNYPSRRVTFVDGEEVKETYYYKLMEIVKDFPDTRVYDLEKKGLVPFKDSCYVPKVKGFPEPSQADGRIMSISVKVFGGTSIAFGLQPLEESFCKEKGIKYNFFSTEQEMLEAFVTFLMAEEPHVLTGYNIILFDIPYLVNRIRKVCGDEWVEYLSPFHKDARQCVREVNKDGQQSYKILGLNIMDFMDFYKKFNPDKHESYKLDYLGTVEGVGNKVDFSEYRSLMNLYLGKWTPEYVKEEKDKFAIARQKVYMEMKKRGIV